MESAEGATSTGATAMSSSSSAISTSASRVGFAWEGTWRAPRATATAAAACTEMESKRARRFPPKGVAPNTRLAGARASTPRPMPSGECSKGRVATARKGVVRKRSPCYQRRARTERSTRTRSLGLTPCDFLVRFTWRTCVSRSFASPGTRALKIRRVGPCPPRQRRRVEASFLPRSRTIPIPSTRQTRFAIASRGPWSWSSPST